MPEETTKTSYNLISAKRRSFFMGVFSNAFEKKWFWIFMFMYVLIMIPFPFFFSTKYIPSIAGLPLFIVGWTLHTAATMVLIYIFYKQAMSRPEYHEFDEDSGK
jgi:hypothetical protein